MQWMRVAHPAMFATWIALALYTSMYFVLALALTRKLDRKGVPLWLSVPVVWVAFEYCRAHFPTGFSWLEPLGSQHLIGFGWYFLGYTQHDYLSLVQVSDITGVYGVSLLILWVNVALFSWLTRTPSSRLLMPTVLASVGVIGSIAYGMMRFDHPPFEEGPRVAALQGNIPQDLKMKKGDELLQPYMNLWAKAAFPTDGSARPDLTIWPETSCPDDWIWEMTPDGKGMRGRLASGTERGSDLERAIDQKYDALLSVLGPLAPAGGLAPIFNSGYFGAVLFGVNTLELNPHTGDWKYNSAVMFDHGQYVSRYDKMHLVPFGEYVPLGSIFPWLQNFTPYKHDYSCKPGELWTRFPLKKGDRTYHFAVIICYEDSEPVLARQYVKSSGEPAVDFFVNISNDGWFRGTEEHEQHLAICRFRAIETRRSIVRAVNMGISAIIDPDGRVIALPGESWSKSKAMEGIVVGNVPIGSGETLFARFGDWLPIGCWLVIFVGMVWGRRRT